MFNYAKASMKWEEFIKFQNLLQKRTREDYTKEQLITLEQAWNDGMRSSGKDHEEKIFNISQSLGVSVERVKVCKNLNNVIFNVNSKFSCALYLTVLDTSLFIPFLCRM